MRPFSFLLFRLFPGPQEGKKIVASAVNSDHPNRKHSLLEFLSQFFDTLSSFGVGFLPPVFLQF
jgi:hypothetical protein